LIFRAPFFFAGSSFWSLKESVTSPPPRPPDPPLARKRECKRLIFPRARPPSLSLFQAPTERHVLFHTDGEGHFSQAIQASPLFFPPSSCLSFSDLERQAPFFEFLTLPSETSNQFPRSLPPSSIRGRRGTASWDLPDVLY